MTLWMTRSNLSSASIHMRIKWPRANLPSNIIINPQSVLSWNDYYTKYDTGTCLVRIVSIFVGMRPENVIFGLLGGHLTAPIDLGTLCSTPSTLAHGRIYPPAGYKSWGRVLSYLSSVVSTLLHLNTSVAPRFSSSPSHPFNSLIIVIMFSFVKAAVVSAALATSAIATSGNAFYFDPGLGACGFTNTSDQFVASVPASVFNGYPGATANPNNNPICQHSVNVTYQGTSVVAGIVDYFTASGIDNYVGLSPAAFEKFAPISQGLITGVDWVIL